MEAGKAKTNFILALPLRVRVLIQFQSWREHFYPLFFCVLAGEELYSGSEYSLE